MRLPIALATFALATTTALPAFAVTPSPISLSLRDAAATPIETVQQRQTRTYRGNYAATPRARRAYAAAPRARSDNDPWARYSNPWGHCAGGLTGGGSSAFPNWDVCGNRPSGQR